MGVLQDIAQCLIGLADSNPLLLLLELLELLELIELLELLELLEL